MVAALPTTTPTLRDSRESVVDYTNADSDIFVSSLPVPVPVPDTLPAPVPDVPRVSLPHVDTQLNMHQYNGLFDLSSSPDGQNSSSAIDSTGGLFRCCLNKITRREVWLLTFYSFPRRSNTLPLPKSYQRRRILNLRMVLCGRPRSHREIRPCHPHPARRHRPPHARMQRLPLPRRRDTAHKRSLQDTSPEHGRAPAEPRASQRNEPALDLAEGPENEGVAGGGPEREG